jgi:phage protein D
VSKKISAQEYTTSVSLSLPMSGITDLRLRNTEIDLLQQENSMDVAMIRIPNAEISGIRSRVATGTPITFTWRTWRGSNTFYGYVHDHQRITRTDSSGIEITAVDAGWPLKETNQRVWVDTTATAVARALATEFGLGFDGDEHDRVFPQVTQPGTSAWSVLVGLAERIGYSVRVEKTTLLFKAKANLAAHFRSLATTLEVGTVGSTPVDFAEVLEFKLDDGEYQPENGAFAARRVMTFVDSQGNIVTASQDRPDNPGRSGSEPLFSHYLSDHTVRSIEDAQKLVRDTSNQHRYTSVAEARAYGIPSLAPHRVLYLDKLPAPTKGYWTILKAFHQIRIGPQYRLTLTVGSDGLGDEQMRPGAVAGDVGIVPLTKWLATPYPEPLLSQGTNYGLMATAQVKFLGGPRWLAGVHS